MSANDWGTCMMKTIHSLDQFQEEREVFLTQGTFDGVHLGHQSILKKLVHQARSRNGVSALLTFYPHPRLVLYPEDNALRLLTTLDEKSRILEELGLDYLIVLPFTQEFSRMEPYQFIRDVLVNGLRMKHCIIGHDHRFGRNREGSIHDLEEMASIFNYTVEQIPARDIENAIISSTKIRHAILEGDMPKANDFLGRPYHLSGKVVHGRKMGHELGYPTANLADIDPFKLVPPNGVYAVMAEFQKVSRPGMLNIGNNPTFAAASWSVETHVFDFQGLLYGEVFKIHFIQRMRDEIRFESLGDLKAQLKKDEAEARKILSEIF